MTAGIILAFLKKNNTIALFTLAFITWLVFTFNNDNPDLLNYQNQYYGLATYYTEPIYVFFQQVCCKLGLSFQAYRGIEAAIGLSITAISIKRISPYSSATYGMYMLFPFFADVVQSRYFLAQSLFLLAISYLIKYKRRKKPTFIIAFLGAFILSVGCHFSAVLFAPLFILFLETDRRNIILYFVVPVLIASIPIWVSLLLPHIEVIIGESKTAAWIAFNSAMTPLGIIRVLMVRLLLPISLILAYRTGPANNYRCETCKEESYDYVSYIRSARDENQTLILIVVYLLMYTSMEIIMEGQYNRIARTNMIIEYVLFSRFVALNKKSNRRVLWGILLLVTIIFVLDVLFFRTVDDQGHIWLDFVFRKVMEYNYLW